ncbi:hypothetical protein [Mycobacterium sp. NAZ190054]|uniref:hypothetical protein n=1 Tax=Mycobacterium sp. NAZ190054 TaxID=1747766 RepID=UPI000A42B5E1|nr:hypothetical protein [Mycobacterium sp. NAZ190054]
MTTEQPTALPAAAPYAGVASVAAPAAFAERVALAARPDNDGESYANSDYVRIAVATIVIPLG